jgi:hypothetical protein
MNYWKLGCRWGSKTEGKPLFFDLLIEHKIIIGWEDKDYKKDAKILLTDGHTVLGVAKTTSLRKSVLDFPEYKEEFEKFQIDYSKNMYIYDGYIVELNHDERFKFKTQVGICGIDKQEIINKMNDVLSNNNSNLMESLAKNKYKELLEYKKQIILQGPPGTGKTRLAKELAEMLIGSTTNLHKPASITNQQIIDTLKDVKIIKTVAGNVDYRLVSVDFQSQQVVLEKSTEAQDTSSFAQIKESYRTKSYLEEIKGNPSRRTSAIANYIFQNIELRSSKFEDSEQFKLIQFHPSYTYEDFVRGIVAKPNPDGSGVLYEAENKILIEIAEKAIQNNLLSSNANVNAEFTTETLFNSFVDDLKEQIGESEEQRIGITEAVYLFEPDEKRFKYKGDNWVAHKNGLNMKFSELQKIIVSGVKERIGVKNIVGLEELTKQHATYFIKVVEKFYDFKEKHESIVQNSNSKKAEPKNYVLIIDEINRANLSSVLGELIYALEYRDEKVESMYMVDKENKLILPQNLYIIGTMNTADRSVGHIDYAIRRRFAFVDVLPEKLEDNNEIWFNTSAYDAVEKLFSKTNVSADFDVKDIQIGHSYFIVKKEDAKPEEKEAIFKMKIKYEVIPILNEYVKDGILIPETKKLIDQLSVSYT